MDYSAENDPIKKKRPKKSHFCQICAKSFRDSYKLKRHEKVHIKAGELAEPTNEEKPKENSEIKKKVNVEKTVRPKLPPKNHVCKECNKSFRDSWKLRRHEKVHLKMKSEERSVDGQKLAEGNLLKGIDNKTITFQFVYICSLLSEIQFIMKQNGSKLLLKLLSRSV